MKYDPSKQHRRSIRLKVYDYSQSGGYYITIVTQNRECLFGNVVDGEMVLNDAGEVVKICWLEIPNHFPNVHFDRFIIMPNHIHGIIFLVRAKNVSPLHSNNENKFHSPSQTIGSIIRGFKIGVTKWFRHNTNVYTVWQRNYYDHIIRNEKELCEICEYIINNPIKWELDNENPNNM